MVEEPEELPAFEYVHLPPSLFFGMTPDSQGVFRMPPEKALLDLLYLQRGRIDWESLDTARLDRTALRPLAARFPATVQRALASSPFSR